MTERNYPQYPMMDNPTAKKGFYAAGMITRDSELVGSGGEKRPLAERTDRAKFFKEFLSAGDREKRKKILERASELDKIYVQFSENQQEVSVNINGLGEQTARFVVLEPLTASDKPPIVLIPGISNDLEGIGEMPIKLAASGRKVVEIAYPESWHGKVTEEFGDAVKGSDKYQPHTDFFRLAINKIVGENNQIDLWGVSTGSLIASNLVADSDFKKRIDNAVLLVPPGEIDHKNFNISMGKEIISTLNKFWLITKLSVSNSKKIETSDEHRRLMLHTFEPLKEKVIHRYSWWNRKLETGTGKKTIVIIGEKDHVTEARKGKKEIESNQTLNLYSIKTGNHNTPSMESEKVIDLVKKLQKED